MRERLNARLSFVSTLLIVLLIFGLSFTTVASINSPEMGYLFCVNNKTKAVSFSGSNSCPKGTSSLQIGAKGLRGDVGPVGPKGDTGSSGIPGPRGFSLLQGTGAPSPLFGDNGDFYFDKNRGEIYGPKFQGNWGSATSLIGPMGATGPQGPSGATGPQGPSGATGPQGPSGAAGISNVFIDEMRPGLSHAGLAPELCHTSDFLLPAGSYLVMAYVDAIREPMEMGPSQMNARIDIGADSSTIISGSSVPQSGHGSVTVIGAFDSVAANSPVKVYCDSSGGVEFSNVVLVAIATNRVTDLP